MGGDFNIDKAHGKYPDHLDIIEYGDFGNLKTRIGKDGQLINTEVNLSNKWKKELDTNK